MGLLDNLKPLSAGQEEMLKALKDKSIEVIGIFGPSGSGKSLFSITYGMDSVLNKDFRRFLIVKPLVNVVSGADLSIEMNKNVYETLIMDYVNDILNTLQMDVNLQDLVNKGLVQFVDLHYLKGRTFDNSLVFIDDIQNIPAESIIEVLIRIGNSSRLIVAGDPVFQRLKKVEKDPSSIIREILLSEEKAKVVDLGLKDIIRPGAKKGLRLLVELMLRSRNLGIEDKKILETILTHAPDADIVTVMDVSKLKNSLNIKGEICPEVIILTKTAGRLIGKGGERIQKIENSLGKKTRTIIFSLDFKEWIRAIHPILWIHKHISEVDFAGPRLRVKINKEEAGAFLGYGGSYIRFVNQIFEELLGIMVEVEQVEMKEEKKEEVEKKKVEEKKKKK
jgi:phosphate starvation-inducible protein PhoH